MKEIFIFLFFILYSNPLLFSNLIYYCTPSGRELLHYCDVVHKYSEEVIIKRRKELMEVFYCTQFIYMFINVTVITGDAA